MLRIKNNRMYVHYNRMYVHYNRMKVDNAMWLQSKLICVLI